MTAEPMDMGDAARRMHEEMRLRAQYGYLFEKERETLEKRIAALENRNRELVLEASEAKQKVRRLESTIAHAERKKGKGRGPKPKVRNRVIYWVTAILDADAAEMGAVLWDERPKVGDLPEPGMKVQTYAALGKTLKLVVDYTVKGGYPADVERMLDKTADRLGVTVLDVECDERSRVPVEDDQMPSEGS